MRNKINWINIFRFRKLRNIKINIGERITVIAGHNGIGKSTILGLIANGSELKGHKSYFDKIFQSQFQEIFHLDADYDYIQDKESKYSVLMEYEYNQEKIYKTCSISKHGDRRLKVVPRNANRDGKQINAPVQDIGSSAKVPIPTLYVGMSRVIPIGESDQSLYSLTSTNVDESDLNYMNTKYKEIIGDEHLNTEKASKQNLRHSTKRSIGPTFEDYPYQSVSLGQDSLSSILTSIISFRKLKRELGQEYKGGLLIIDEVDACLHPSAQEKLITVLDKASKSLMLQIICTSHSLTVIKEVIGRQIQTRQNPADNRLHYNVVYLQNTIRPMIMKEPNYKKIKNDMFLRYATFNDDFQEIKVYMEDAEAKFLLQSILKFSDGVNLDGVRLNKISANISCDTLLKLPSKDSYFKSVIILLDGDVKKRTVYQQIIDENENICILPGELSPEYTIHHYLEELVKNSDHPYWIDNQEYIHSQLVRDNILNDINDRLENANDKKYREHYKEWFRRHQLIFEKTELLRYWIHDNEDDLGEFFFQFNLAIDFIKKLYITNY
ncbi:AAA family ATPase [Bacillus ginsengihumi]|uniref:AAA family ATPase n=1 Tax=Heyndrickxia ginsengihumi TaxID=363870 RepID=A0A6M0P9F1_9BACI|nr:AAA family ATPase [Heyndrickxia ginsengihumi]NEY20530.1 AAA family ATPase [Heyndrickxia ginsengihumi]